MTAAAYKLIEFTKETKEKQRSVDFVPCGWITYDPVFGSLVTQFMPPPYDDENSALLHSLIKSAAPAPEDWPSYCIDIRGEARTYEEALKKLDVLESKKYAYSTDSEQTARNKASAAHREYEKKRLRADIIEEKELWKVPNLTQSDSDDQCIPASDISSSSANSSPVSSGKNHLKYKINKKMVVNTGKTGWKKPNKNETKDKNVSYSGKAKVQAKEIPVTTISKVTQRHDRVCRNINSENAVVPILHSSKSKCSSPSTTQLHHHKDKYSNDDTTTTVLFDDVLNVINTKEISNEPKPSIDSIIQVVNKGFRSLSVQQTKVSTQLEELKILLTDENNKHLSEVLNTDNFAEKHNLQLPFKVLKDFQTFDSDLKNDATLRNDIKANMWTSVQRKSPTATSIRSILKKFLSRDVLQNYTAIKETVGKLIFQKTSFCACIEEVILTEFNKNQTASPVTSKHFYKGMSSVINGAKDWDGHRTIRSKNRPALATAVAGD